MAIALDASTPNRWSGAPINNGTITSSSFTAPANTLLLVCLEGDGNTASFGTVTNTVSDSGGLTWTKAVERTTAEATDGGTAAIWWALTSTAAARTVTVTHTHSALGGSGCTVAATCYV